MSFRSEHEAPAAGVYPWCHASCDVDWCLVNDRRLRVPPEVPSPPRASSSAPAPAVDERQFAAVVGEAIRTARQQLGMTQVQVAERAGLSSNYVARLERGELGPSLFVATRLAEALEVTVDHLVSGGGGQAVRTTTRRKAL